MSLVVPLTLSLLVACSGSSSHKADGPKPSFAHPCVGVDFGYFKKVFGQSPARETPQTLPAFKDHPDSYNCVLEVASGGSNFSTLMVTVCPHDCKELIGDLKRRPHEKALPGGAYLDARFHEVGESGPDGAFVDVSIPFVPDDVHPHVPLDQAARHFADDAVKVLKQ